MDTVVDARGRFDERRRANQRAKIPGYLRVAGCFALAAAVTTGVIKYQKYQDAQATEAALESLRPTEPACDFGPVENWAQIEVPTGAGADALAYAIPGMTDACLEAAKLAIGQVNGRQAIQAPQAGETLLVPPAVVAS